MLDIFIERLHFIVKLNFDPVLMFRYNVKLEKGWYLRERPKNINWNNIFQVAQHCTSGRNYCITIRTAHVEAHLA